jgi:DNA-binding HxlR family transcriptional regulator
MELGINILSGKWRLPILWRISTKESIRFNELQRSLGNITTKTLTQQLRELEEQKIIMRIVYPEVPPKVEYSLTEIGKTIIPILKSLCDWGVAYKEMAAEQ